MYHCDTLSVAVYKIWVAKLAFLSLVVIARSSAYKTMEAPSVVGMSTVYIY